MKRLLLVLLAAAAVTGLWLAAGPNDVAAEPAGERLATATFAGGCFWCMEPPFDKLEGDQREVFRMAQIVGLAHKDIAERLGKTELAVRSLLKRAKVRLGRFLVADRPEAAE